MILGMPNSRGSSITIIGGLSNKRGILASHIFEGHNNSSRFQEFLLNLKYRINGKATCVMDNLTVHHSTKARELFDEDFRALYLPPYSCALNPIERLWAIIKDSWRKVVLLRGQRLATSEDVIREIRRIIDSQN